MAKILMVFLVVAVIGGSYGMTFRHKRQSNDNEGGLDDRYGRDRPRQMPPWFPNQNRLPGQFPNGGQNQFPWQNQNQNEGQGQFPLQNQGQNGGQGQSPWQNQQQTTPPNSNGVTTISSSVRQCMSSCPVTSEYNPVCGSDSVTYTNPGRLSCAISCGVSVTLIRSSPCPTTTTAAPTS